MGETAVSFNKAMVHDLFWMWQCLMLLLTPTSHGGEGRLGEGVRICRSGSWWDLLLQVGDTHMVTFQRRHDLWPWRRPLLGANDEAQPPVEAILLQIRVGTPLLFYPKWQVPSVMEEKVDDVVCSVDVVE
jgi:hypothetical protein